MASVPVEAASAVTWSVPGPAVTPAERALTLAVSTAVSQLNDAGVPGAGREVTFSLDPGSRRPVVKVIDTSTKQVVDQWPSEYVLQLAKDYNNKARDSG